MNANNGNQAAPETAHIGGTIGLSMYPDDGEDDETLIRNADIAMYHGKRSGRSRCYFYRPETNLRAIERQRIEIAHRCEEMQGFRFSGALPAPRFAALLARGGRD